MEAINFPETFKHFLIDNDIPIDEYMANYTKTVPRYIRLMNGLSKIEQSSILSRINTKCTPTFLDSFFSIDPDFKIVNIEPYINGEIFGIDFASGVAVNCLEIQPDDAVLDLCCSPGAKLLYIADLIGNDGKGSVTGVDISTNRLLICKNLIRKYKVRKARLFDVDGTTFNIHAPSRIGGTWKHSSLANIPSNSLVNVNPLFATQMIRSSPQIEHPDLLYDKVLVDAECTHDGSIIHIKKHQQANWVNFEEKFMGPRLAQLCTLQRELLSNGFRLLKPGGILVYSTCSFSKKQNEDIIAWFIGRNKDALLEKAAPDGMYPIKKTEKDDLISRFTMRFTPSDSGTSGFFLAKIRKKPI